MATRPFFSDDEACHFRSSFSSGQWQTLDLTSTRRLDRERISDFDGGFANDLFSDSTFRELDHSLQKMRSDLRTYGDRGSRKLWDAFSNDMAKVTLAAWRRQRGQQL